MTLEAWLSAQVPKLSAEAFGRQIDLTGQAVRRYCSGERMPNAETIEKIEKATRGAVTVTDIHAARLAFLKAMPTASENAA